MGSVGDAYDKAMCESFFATLECELLDRQRFQTQAEAKMAVFDFIEGFYNPRRAPLGLGSALAHQLVEANIRRSEQNHAQHFPTNLEPGRCPAGGKEKIR